MNPHNLKHPPAPPQGREAVKGALHRLITEKLAVEPFQPFLDHDLVNSAKAGRFNQSNCAIALYSNAYSEKAMFPEDAAPLGYLSRRDGDLLSFGVYRRNDGKLFGSILPLTGNLNAIASFSHRAMEELPLSGVYVRFLKVPEYSRLVSDLYGFKPAKEEPWLPDAPEEDESLSHSRVDLSKVVQAGGRGFAYEPLKRSFRRGNNFLERGGLDYRFVPLTQHNLTSALNIIKSHFTMIEKKDKLVGSSHFDYYGLLHPDIISLKSVVAYLGFIRDLPVSVFICESNGPQSMAGYAGITLRDVDYISLLGKPGESMGSRDLVLDQADPALVGASAIPTYAMARLFLEIHKMGFRYFFMGGSEHADIDRWKERQMGAEKDPTYWAILTK
jgi:hypothetical protein